jgi:hypothetical protein
MHFPEQWGSQTRPADPDTNFRKRRIKRRKQTPEDTEMVDGTEMVDDTCNAAAKRQHTSGKQDSTCLDVNIQDTFDTRHSPDIATDLVSTGLVSSSSTQITHTDTTTRVFIAPPPNKEACTTQPPIMLNIQTLLSRLPYQQMLNQVFTDDAKSTDTIPVVTRVYEESFMREPIYDHERKCVCGDACEFNFIDASIPFVGVEFTLNTDTQDEEPQMCVLCSRRTTQEMFYNMVYNGHRFRGFIQRYGNLCQQPGEYAREAMLICPQSSSINHMPLPIVAHHRHRYSVYSQNGTRYLHQHNVYYEDFHEPSSSQVQPRH